MDISILETKPLELYQSTFFHNEKDENIAKGIGHLIYFLYSGEVFPNPVYREIEKVDFDIIRNMVFEALDYARKCGPRTHNQEIDDAIHFFGLDGYERIPSYVEIAEIRNVHKVSVIESHVMRTAARIGDYFQKHHIDTMFLHPKTSENMIDIIDEMIASVEKMLEKVKAARERISKE